MYFLLLARCKHPTTSISERREYPKNLLNSESDCPVEPSAIFNETESAARLICDVRTYISSFGKCFVTPFTISDKSTAFCQTISFSNLNGIHCRFKSESR